MRKTVISAIVIIIIATLIGGTIFIFSRIQPDEKIYVAVEGDGVVKVINPDTRKVINSIDLSIEHEGGRLTFAPHNVQVSPDNKSVWVTANVGGHKEHGFSFIQSVYAHGEESIEPDEVIIINPITDEIIKRIEVAPNLHLAHVVFTPNSQYTYITSQNEGTVYKINAVTFEIEKKIILKSDGEPHGLRIAPDGSYAYIAMLKGKSLNILNLKNDEVTEVPLNGSAVQTGITPDGKFVVISLYDTKQLAIYREETKSVTYVGLPQSAKGVVQMYPTPDSRFVYIADQGYYFDQEVSEWVYKVDLTEGSVVKEIKVGKAPHGVIVSNDGKFVYVTNLLSNDVSVIATETDAEIVRIPIGKEPNGISIWNKNK